MTWDERHEWPDGVPELPDVRPEISTTNAEVLTRHRERVICGSPFRGVICGSYERDALHDLYPDVSKRDPLPPNLYEDERHEFFSFGSGYCDADEDEWPCSAYRLATGSAT